MKIAIHSYTSRGGSVSAAPYTEIVRATVPQIGALLKFGAIIALEKRPDGTVETVVSRRALSGRVRDVIETDDPSAPEDRPTVTIVVEEIVQ